MPIIATDLRLRLAGGLTNTDVHASLGGIINTVPADVSTTVSEQNLFRNILGDESSVGSTKYRGLYLHNLHASLSLTLGYVWIPTQTPSTSTIIAIALSAEGTGTMTAIANENTAPATVSFTSPATKGAGLLTGTTTSLSKYGLWFRRIVNAGASALNNDDWSVSWEGDTEA